MAAAQTTESVKATQDAGSRRPYNDAAARRFKLPYEEIVLFRKLRLGLKIGRTDDETNQRPAASSLFAR